VRNLFCRSPSSDAYDNLALDEHLLNIAQPGELYLYLYVNAKAVILGRNQNPWKECDLEAMRQDGVQLVRRLSGGGAVYHDRGNLNFSFISGAGRGDEAAQNALLLAALQDFGLAAEFTGRNDFCTPDGRKFSGTAYCNRGDRRLRHGTLLIDANLGDVQKYLTPRSDKLAAHGVDSVRGRVCNLRELRPGLTVEDMAAALFRRFGADETVTPSGRDIAEVAGLRAKNASETWIFGATPKFDTDAMDPDILLCHSERGAESVP